MRKADVKAMLPEKLEREVMIHRYIYYVLCDIVISDFEYDILENQAKLVLPETSPVFGVSSSLPSSYSESIRNEAAERLQTHQDMR